jgi:hypothetical protein
LYALALFSFQLLFLRKALQLLPQHQLQVLMIINNSANSIRTADENNDAVTVTGVNLPDWLSVGAGDPDVSTLCLLLGLPGWHSRCS